MTGREVIDRQLRRGMVIVHVGGALFMCGLAAAAIGGGPGGYHPAIAVVCLTGFGISCLGWLYVYTTARCPWCRGHVSSLAQGMYALGQRVRFCPYCGRSIDDELVAEEQVGVDGQT